MNRERLLNRLRYAAGEKVMNHRWASLTEEERRREMGRTHMTQDREGCEHHMGKRSGGVNRAILSLMSLFLKDVSLL